jgi:hypothetical protein
MENVFRPILNVVGNLKSESLMLCYTRDVKSREWRQRAEQSVCKLKEMIDRFLAVERMPQARQHYPAGQAGWEFDLKSCFGRLLCEASDFLRCSIAFPEMPNRIFVNADEMARISDLRTKAEIVRSESEANLQRESDYLWRLGEDVRNESTPAAVTQRAEQQSCGEKPRADYSVTKLRAMTTASASQVAKAIGQPYARVESLLRRLRSKKPSCTLDTDPDVKRATDPKYLYRIPEMLPDLENALARWSVKE